MSATDSYNLSSLFDDNQEADSMSANLFSTGAGKSGGDSGAAILEQGESNVGRLGHTNVRRSHARLYPGMDLKRALVKDIEVHVTADNRMSDEEAGRLLLSMLSRCGLGTEDDAVMVGFVKAMCLCMAINSSSILVPGRSKFYVAGSEFDFFTDVLAVLGNDARRFFRAYADVTRGYLKGVIAEYQRGAASDDDRDVDRYEHVVDMYNAIKYVAEKRGLTRAMDLIHDSAEFCSNKTAVERAILMSSKETIFANGAHIMNLVDNPVVARPRQSRNPGAVVSGSDALPDGY